MEYKTKAFPLHNGLNRLEFPIDFEFLNVICYRSTPFIIINYSENKTVKRTVEVCSKDIKVNTLPVVDGKSTAGYQYLGSVIVYNDFISDQLLHIWLQL